jgi:protein-L-isoaspartate(D-aspartate) O-methyltransferase
MLSLKMSHPLANDFDREREAAVRELERHGITDARVLRACALVPREEFVPEAIRDRAYVDGPQDIGLGQTISQLHIVALTAQALLLSGTERLLEVGTGSGYAAAIFSHLVKEVYSVERLAELAEPARERLARLGYGHIHVVTGDGTLGLVEHAPFEAIAVAACGPRVPMPLLEQLSVMGRLVMPVGAEPSSQALFRIIRQSQILYEEERLVSVRFVPLIGKEGFAEK